MKYYKKLVTCKINIQKWVSIYETCECDIRAPDIHRFPRVDGVVNWTPGIGASQSRVGPRLKVGVLVEGNAWTLKPGVSIGDSRGKFGRPWVSSFRVFEKLRLRSKR